MNNYKIKSINLIVLIVIVSCFLFSAACRKTNKTFSETNRISTVSLSYEEKNDNGQSEDDAQIIVQADMVYVINKEFPAR